MSTKKRKTDKQVFADILYGAMLALVVGIMPLVIRLVIRNIPQDVRHIRMSTIQGLPYSYIDFFVSGKLWILAGAALVMALYCIGDWLTGGKLPKFKPYLKRVPIILSLIYLAFVFISAIASEYSNTSWFGTVERQEGAITWLLYFVVFVAAMFYVRDPKYTKPILWGLTFSSIIMGIIGFSQLIGHNLLVTSFAVRLMTWGHDVESFGAPFVIANGTLFNPNTFGKYTAMVAPILLLCGFVYEGKLYMKAAMLFGGALMLIGVFASGSLGGLIGIAAAAGVIVVTYLCYVFKNREGNKNATKAVVVFTGVAAIITVSLIIVPPLNYRFTTLLNRLQEAAAAETTAQERFAFERNSVFIYRGQDRLLSATVNSFDEQENWLTVRDGMGIEITPSSADPYVFFVPELGPLGVHRYQDHFAISTAGQNNPFLLHFDNNTVFGISAMGMGGRNLSEPVPAWGFAGRETWGSSRGFIWSRSFPLMPGNTIIGSGPDTFINVFPYYDMTGLHLAFNCPYHIVDKAHNLFIQTWITTGGISAIALFGLFFFYLATTFWSLVTSKDEPRYLFGMRFGLLAGISGFVMASMATDSTVGSTGVFFVLLGMGYGLNYFLKNQGQTANNKTKNATKPNNKA